MSELSEETRRLLELTSTATLTTQLFKRGLRNTFVQGVRRLTPSAPVMVGEAFTLRMIPARGGHFLLVTSPISPPTE